MHSFFVSEAISSVEILDLSSLSWRPGPPLPRAIRGAASVQFGDSFLVVGGQDGDGASLSSVYEYNPVDEEWALRAEELSLGRRGVPAVTAVNGHFMECH